ncbi:Insecticidal Crystal Toxin, P42 [Pseudomonas sp. 24 E 13]|uniref:DUF946 domain-containing protein n=1 Tax=Pseudomonas orientalis TaxID=76758 RepID=A0A4Q7CVV3_9PSED|nr:MULTISPECIES: Vps62-related protein [Pseudomonas]RZI29542.1 DUF946 domain-containing protein [Pseudomonas orientalis]CRM20579.1 Insecticidal Crystal Toxin, P42 [Pseudomonas sp. 24 E 13]
MVPLKYKDLLINFTNNFTHLWNNRRREDGHFGDAPAGVWRPRIPPKLAGYYPIGDRLEDNFNTIDGVQAMPVVADANGPTGTALKPPTDFERVWAFEQPGHNVSIWRPVPPEGYVAMGLVVGNGLLEPSVNAVRCLRDDLPVTSHIDELLWSDRGTGAPGDFSAWSVKPPTAPPAEVYFSAATFMGQPGYARPLASPPVHALRAHMLIESTAPSVAPILHSYAKPSAFEKTTTAYVTQLPWFTIEDPDLTPMEQLTQTPYYQLERKDYYVLLNHAHNNTSTVQRYNWASTRIENGSTTESTSQTVGTESSVELQFASFFKASAKISLSVTHVSTQTRGWAKSETYTVWCTLGPHKAVAVYLINSDYRLLRADGRQVGQMYTRSNENSLYWSEYPATQGNTVRVSRSIAGETSAEIILP